MFNLFLFVGPVGSQLYPSANANQMLNNKDSFSNVPANTNNNQLGYSNNAFPNNNSPYGGQSGMNSNSNFWPNNNNNNNNNMPYYMNNPNGNSWSPNRELNNNNNNNNIYSNPSSPYFYNHGDRMITSCFVVLFTFIILCFSHI